MLIFNKEYTEFIELIGPIDEEFLDEYQTNWVNKVKNKLNKLDEIIISSKKIQETHLLMIRGLHM